MNIACYNLRFGGNANNRVPWQRIFEAADPDIFLAQETCSRITAMPSLCRRLGIAP